MAIELTAPQHDLDFMAPLSQARAGRLVRYLADGLTSAAHTLVLDIGCGWAELLLRVLDDVEGATGVGLDCDGEALEHGRRLAEQRGASARVELLCGDARTLLPVSADALICVGASQIWGPPSEDAQPLDYGAALSALRALVPRGGRVVYGESIWSQPPTPQAIAQLAGRDDEYLSLAELLEITVGCGFALVQVCEATLDEWDDFESGYSACYARWLAAHDRDHPDSGEVARLAKRQRTGFFNGYRGVLGFAYLGLIAI